MSYISTQSNAGPSYRGIGLALAIHAGVVGVYFLLPDEVIPDIIDRPIEAIFVIPEKEEVVPPPQELPVDPPKQPESEIDRVKPEVDRPLPDMGARRPIDDVDNLPKQGAVVGGSGVADNPPADPPPPDPVIVDAKIDPRYRSGFQPDYPSNLRRLEREGSVTVRALVGPDGRVRDVQMVRTDDAAFWEATRRHALRKWRFKAATRDGQPVESWYTLTVRFELTG